MNQFAQQVLSNQNTIILSRSIRQILVKSKLSERQDLLFKPLYAKPKVKVFAKIVDCSMKKILMRNNTNITLVISGKTKLGRVVKYKADECYKAHINAVDTAPTNPQCLTICDLLTYHSYVDPSKSTLKNRITIYRDQGTVNNIAQIAQKFEPRL